MRSSRSAPAPGLPPFLEDTPARPGRPARPQAQLADSMGRCTTPEQQGQLLTGALKLLLLEQVVIGGPRACLGAANRAAKWAVWQEPGHGP